MESGKGRVAAGVDDGEAEVRVSWSRFAEGGRGFVDVVSQAVGRCSVFGRSGFGLLWVMGCDYREGAVDIICKGGRKYVVRADDFWWISRTRMWFWVYDAR